jgi:hypothetical protein
MVMRGDGDAFEDFHRAEAFVDILDHQCGAGGNCL